METTVTEVRTDPLLFLKNIAKADLDKMSITMSGIQRKTEKIHEPVPDDVLMYIGLISKQALKSCYSHSKTLEKKILNIFFNTPKNILNYMEENFRTNLKAHRVFNEVFRFWLEIVPKNSKEYPKVQEKAQYLSQKEPCIAVKENGNAIESITEAFATINFNNYITHNNNKTPFETAHMLLQESLEKLEKAQKNLEKKLKRRQESEQKAVRKASRATKKQKNVRKDVREKLEQKKLSSPACVRIQKIVSEQQRITNIILASPTAKEYTSLCQSFSDSRIAHNKLEEILSGSELTSSPQESVRSEEEELLRSLSAPLTPCRSIKSIITDQEAIEKAFQQNYREMLCCWNVFFNSIECIFYDLSDMDKINLQQELINTEIFFRKSSIILLQEDALYLRTKLSMLVFEYAFTEMIEDKAKLRFHIRLTANKLCKQERNADSIKPLEKILQEYTPRKYNRLTRSLEKPSLNQHKRSPFQGNTQTAKYLKKIEKAFVSQNYDKIYEKLDKLKKHSDVTKNFATQVEKCYEVIMKNTPERQNLSANEALRISYYIEKHFFEDDTSTLGEQYTQHDRLFTYVKKEKSGLPRTLLFDCSLKNVAILHKLQGDIASYIELPDGTKQKVYVAGGIKKISSALFIERKDDMVAHETIFAQTKHGRRFSRKILTYLKEFNGIPGLLGYDLYIEYTDTKKNGHTRQAFIQDRATGDLATLITHFMHEYNTTWPQDVWRSIFFIIRDVVTGLQYLHDIKGLIHWDIKLANILYKKPTKTVDTPTGILNDYDTIFKGGKEPPPDLYPVYGTVRFKAPEHIFDDNSSEEESILPLDAAKARDMYALGCMLYEIFTAATGIFPEKMLFEEIADKEVTKEELEQKMQEITSIITPEQHLLIISYHLLHPDPRIRWNCKKLLSYLKDTIECLFLL